MSKRRVVVTGLGMISPLGSQVEKAWKNAIEGQSGICSIREFDTSEFTTQFAGMVPDFNVLDYMSTKESRKFDAFVQYGVAAGIQAMRDAGLDSYEKLVFERAGVSMGSGIGGIGTIEANHRTLMESGPKRISPFFIPGSIVNMVSGLLSIQFGLKGPTIAVATACTTAAHSIGLAARLIMYGDADVMLAGGSEQATTPLGLGGFAALRALSTRNDAPQLASRPWDKERDGFVLGDGAGALVLEEYEHAKKRGARIYAEVVGFGMSSDAFHITRPAEGGVGAAQAMQNAIQDASINAEEIQYINAHATSTLAGDAEEIHAIKQICGSAISKVAVSSTKSMTGHLLGAAGAVEAVFSILAIRDQVAPPTINLDNPDEGCDLNLVAKVAQEMPINITMSNSFGFGGTNGALFLEKCHEKIS